MQNQTVFKAGDKVRCIDARNNPSLKEGSIYTVSEVEENSVVLEDLEYLGGYYSYRFKPVQEKITPAQEAGFVIGNKYIVKDATNNRYTSEGMIVEFLEDDGSTRLLFKVISSDGTEEKTQLDDVYIDIDCLGLVEKPEQESAVGSNQQTFTIDQIEEAYYNARKYDGTTPWNDFEQNLKVIASREATKQSEEYKQYLALHEKYKDL